MPDDITLKGVLVHGLGSKQFAELVETICTEEASVSNLQCDDGSEVSVGASISQIFILADFPLSSTGDVGFKVY